MAPAAGGAMPVGAGVAAASANAPSVFVASSDSFTFLELSGPRVTAMVNFAGSASAVTVTVASSAAVFVSVTRTLPSVSFTSRVLVVLTVVAASGAATLVPSPTAVTGTGAVLFSSPIALFASVLPVSPA